MRLAATCQDHRPLVDRVINGLISRVSQLPVQFNVSLVVLIDLGSGLAEEGILVWSKLLLILPFALLPRY